MIRMRIPFDGDEIIVEYDETSPASPGVDRAKHAERVAAKVETILTGVMKEIRKQQKAKTSRIASNLLGSFPI